MVVRRRGGSFVRRGSLTRRFLIRGSLLPVDPRRIMYTVCMLSVVGFAEMNASV